MLTKRDMLKFGAGAAVLGAAACSREVVTTQAGISAQATATPPPLSTSANPITAEMRLQRIARAQALMREQNIGALLLEPGASMEYFAGLKWWRSERLTAVIIPAEGEIGIVTPYFEEGSIREGMQFDAEVRTWLEHESPFKRVDEFLDDRNVSLPLGIEDSVRFFVVDGLRKEMPKRGLTHGGPIAYGCRMIKTPEEIALMQIANDITMEAYKSVFRRVEKGMTPSAIRQMMNDATVDFGGQPTFSLVLLGEASSYPHGSDQPQEVTEGKVILMDCGCDVYGYKSDISRTWVYGEPTAEQRRVWDVVRKGQELAMETAQVGTPAGRIDDVVRAMYAQEGFGPDYQAPGLTHRLGHGIGMEVHEPINFVRGESTPLAPGMCLSNEPGIYIPGAFGVRHEDCIYMTEDGPKLFSGLSASIENPMGTA